MPALGLVARQWQRQWQWQWHRRILDCSARRHLAYAVREQDSAIIIPSSPSTARPHDLVPHIVSRGQNQRRNHRLRDARREPHAIIFVTPAFATWLQDPHVFLKPALDNLYKEELAHSARPLEVHALAAVVDKLPSPQPLDDPNAIHHDVLHRSLHPPVSDAGHEGVAYVKLRPGDVFVGDPAEEGFDGQGKIDFSSRGGDNAAGYYADTLRLTLANTVFQTGSPSTMFETTWVRGPVDGSNLVMESKTDMKRAALVNYPGCGMLDCVTALSVPLVPLTYPRLVTECMGNILRRVQGTSKAHIHASHELEQAVPQYFESRNQPTQAVAVWALVTPEEIVPNLARLTAELVEGNDRQEVLSLSTAEAWARFWRSDPIKWNDLVPSALARGARLHRVLSGGGGWGNKAGLLALDPSFHSDELSFPPLTTQEGEEPQALDSAIHKIVEGQDSVQFFVSPTPFEDASTTYEAKSTVLAQLASSSQAHWRWELGMIPSTADTLENSSWQYTNRAPPSTPGGHIFVLAHSFGALSECGLTLQRETRGSLISPWAFSGGTTVDVPFSRFSAVVMDDIEIKEKMREESRRGKLEKMDASDTAAQTILDEERKLDSNLKEGESNRSDAMKIQSQSSGEIEVGRSDTGHNRLSALLLKPSASSLSMRASQDNRPSRTTKTIEPVDYSEQLRLRIPTLVNYWDKRSRKVRSGIRSLTQETDEVLATLEEGRAPLPQSHKPDTDQGLLKATVVDLKNIVEIPAANEDVPHFRKVQFCSTDDHADEKEQLQTTRADSTTIEQDKGVREVLRIKRVHTSSYMKGSSEQNGKLHNLEVKSRLLQVKADRNLGNIIRRISDYISLVRTSDTITGQTDTIDTTLITLHAVLRWMLSSIAMRLQDRRRDLPLFRTSTISLQKVMIRLRILFKSESVRPRVDALESRYPRLKDLRLKNEQKVWKKKNSARTHVHQHQTMLRKHVGQNMRSLVRYSHGEHRARRRGRIARNKDFTIRFHASGTRTTSVVRRHVGHRVRRIRRHIPSRPRHAHRRDLRVSSSSTSDGHSVASLRDAQKLDLFGRRSRERLEASQRKGKSIKQKEMGTVLAAVEGWLKGS